MKEFSRVKNGVRHQNRDGATYQYQRRHGLTAG
jgi:hypothetical protein